MVTATLVEKHDFLKGSSEYKELDKLCFLSKNLYNAGLYTVRQHFFATKKFLPYCQLTSQFAETNQADFRALPAKVTQHTLKLINQNLNAFFAFLKLKAAGEYQSKVKIPQYLEKQTGRQVLNYTSQAVSTKARPGYYQIF